MDPGRPLYLRPQILAILLPFLAIAGIIAAAGSDPNRKHSSYSTAGSPGGTYPSATRSPIPATTFTAGHCVWNTHQPNGGQDDDNADVRVLPCDDPRAQATVLGALSRPTPASGSTESEPAEALCGSAYLDSDAYYTETHSNHNLRTTLIVCLRRKGHRQGTRPIALRAGTGVVERRRCCAAISRAAPPPRNRGAVHARRHRNALSSTETRIHLRR